MLSQVGRVGRVGAPNKARGNAPTFTPATLFANSEAGAWYDSSDTSTLAQNSDGTTSVSVGDPVGFVDDKANDLDATQATDSKRPVLRDTPLRLEFDVTDDTLNVTIPTGGITGTLLIGTTGGIVQAEVNLSAGTWSLVNLGEIAYPGNDLVGLILIDRVLNTSEQSNAISWLQDKGAGPIDFSAAGNNRTRWFTGWSYLTALDVSEWDTSGVTQWNFAFNGTSLTGLDVSQWSTNSFTNLKAFIRLSNVPSLDVSNWNTSQVTNFSNFADNDGSLTTVTVNGGTGNPFADSPCTSYSNAFRSTNLDQQSIDDILVAIEAAGTSNGTFDQSGGSAPSATGETAIDALRGRGWTVSVTGGY